MNLWHRNVADGGHRIIHRAHAVGQLRRAHREHAQAGYGPALRPLSEAIQAFLVGEVSGIDRDPVPRTLEDGRAALESLDPDPVRELARCLGRCRSPSRIA